MEATLGGDVGLGHDILFLQGDHPREVEKETLARAIFPDDEPHRGAAPLDPAQVIEHRGDLVSAADLEVAEADPGHDAGAERLEDGVALAGLHHNRIRHDHSAIRCAWTTRPSACPSMSRSSSLSWDHSLITSMVPETIRL